MRDWQTTPPTREQVDEWQGTDERGWARAWEYESEGADGSRYLLLEPDNLLRPDVDWYGEFIDEAGTCDGLIVFGWNDGENDRIRRVLVSPTGDIEGASASPQR